MKDTAASMKYLAKNTYPEFKQVFRPPFWLKEGGKWHHEEILTQTECGMFYETTGVGFSKGQGQKRKVRRPIPEH